LVDKELLLTKIAHVRRCLGKLRRKQSIPKDRFLKDEDIQDSVLHNLQLAVQGCIDLGTHIVSDEDWEVPGSNAEVFEVLGRHGIIDPLLQESMESAARFRNLVIHEYAEMDMEVVYRVLHEKLSDVEQFCYQLVKGFRIT
jgi:uncharacterized protein YutE (UPF0331/DUF86 family)